MAAETGCQRSEGPRQPQKGFWRAWRCTVLCWRWPECAPLPARQLSLATLGPRQQVTAWERPPAIRAPLLPLPPFKLYDQNFKDVVDK